MQARRLDEIVEHVLLAGDQSATAWTGTLTARSWSCMPGKSVDDHPFLGTVSTGERHSAPRGQTSIRRCRDQRLEQRGTDTPLT